MWCARVNVMPTTLLPPARAVRRLTLVTVLALAFLIVAVRPSHGFAPDTNDPAAQPPALTTRRVELPPSDGASLAAEPSQWSKPVLCVFCLVTVLLSAIYCGLTIGIMGINAVYLEIIAEAGSEPDRSYAATILPIRRLNHRLLVTLLVGNMLTLVLTTQLVTAIVDSSEWVNFIVSTFLILIFGEILPMSACNHPQYALLVGSTCLPLLQITLFLLYPVTKPLSMFLDRVVKHDIDMLYSRDEMKQLIQVHFDRYADRTGIDAEQTGMMLRALEMSKLTVRSAMTALEDTVMLEASVPVNACLQRRLWEYGKSRIPVYEGDRQNIIGLLYVKEMIHAPVWGGGPAGAVAGGGGGGEPQTLRDFVVEHPRSIHVVSPTTAMREALLVFQQYAVQFVFVGEEREEPPIPAGAAAAATPAAARQGSEERAAVTTLTPVRLPTSHAIVSRCERHWVATTVNETGAHVASQEGLRAGDEEDTTRAYTGMTRNNSATRTTNADDSNTNDNHNNHNNNHDNNIHINNNNSNNAAMAVKARPAELTTTHVALVDHVMTRREEVWTAAGTPPPPPPPPPPHAPIASSVS